MLEMKQQTFTDIEYSKRKVRTCREEFLNAIDRIIPWSNWIELIEPYYPSGKRVRPTRGIETMLRMYLLQNWFNLSDVGVEEAIYDSYAMRSFMRIDFKFRAGTGCTGIPSWRSTHRIPRPSLRSSLRPWARRTSRPAWGLRGVVSA